MKESLANDGVDSLDEWEKLDIEPLPTADGASARPDDSTHHSTEPAPSSQTLRNRRTGTEQSSSSSKPDPSTSMQLWQPHTSVPGGTSTLMTIRNQPTKTHDIVNHPMQRFASHFLHHLARELWNLDWNIRFAAVSLLCGSALYLVHAVFGYLLYPRQLIWSVTLTAAVVVPMGMYYQPKLLAALKELELNHQSLSPSDKMARLLDHFDAKQLRLLAGVVLFIVPAVMELRTLQFLTNLVGSSTISFVGFFLALTGAAWHWKRDNNNDNDWDLLWLIPRRCTQMGLYLLYGSALWVALGTDWRHIPSLASRFFLATAVLLWKTSATDTSQAVHTALRLTVRDALTEVGTTVQQDEMLQLAMLRWIVDYWSTGNMSGGNGGGGSHGGSSTASKASTNTATNARASDGHYSTTSNSSSSASNNTAETRRPPSQSATQIHKDIEWTELWGMLQTTTNQMTTEVETLQHDTPSSTTLDSQDQTRQSSSPVSNSLPDDSNSSRHSQTGTPPHAHTANSTSSAAGPQFDDSVESLQAMLSSMDIDERAKPAVLAYKRAVETFPPSRRAAFVFGAVHRCPAIGLLSCYILSTVTGLYRPGIAMVLLLLPFCLFEYVRVRLWVEACQRSTETPIPMGTDYWLLENVKSMTILLMDESYNVTSKVPTLLAVWSNIVSSVSALEMSLTAARCVQTTVAAVDFAANILNLANFGYEVSQHGWMHGVSIVAQELMHLHTTGTDISNLSHGIATPNGASYTSSAVSALRNTQTMNRNLRVLADEEETTSSIVAPVLGTLSVLIGQGWLWSNQSETIEGPSAAPQSSVVITELADDDIGVTEQSDVAVPIHSSRDKAETSLRASEKHVSLEDQTVPRERVEEQGRRPSVGRTQHASTEEPEQSKNVSIIPIGVGLNRNVEHEEKLSTSLNDASAPVDTATTLEDQPKDDGITILPFVQAQTRKRAASGKNLIKDFETESSKMMNLLAECDELCLLAQDEKQSILEKFSARSRTPNSESVAWVLGVKATLTGLLNAHASTEDEEAVSTVNEEPLLGTTAAELPSAVVNVSDLNEDASFEPFEGLDLSTNDHGALSVSSAESCADKKHSVDIHEIESDDGFEPIHSEAIASSQAMIVVEDRNEFAKEKTEDDNNIWMAVGSSLAVIGAVVGGVALAAAQNGGEDDKKRRRRNGGSSS